MAITQKYCGKCDTTTYVVSDQRMCAVCGEPLREVQDLHRSIDPRQGAPLHGDFIEMQGVDGGVLLGRTATSKTG